MTWQSALWLLAGVGLAAAMAYTFRMAVYAHAYVADRLKAWRAYDSERLEHEATRACLQRVEALCQPLGWDANERPLHEWLDQRFAAHRAEALKLRTGAWPSVVPSVDGLPTFGVADKPGLGIGPSAALKISAAEQVLEAEILSARKKQTRMSHSGIRSNAVEALTAHLAKKDKAS